MEAKSLLRDITDYCRRKGVAESTFGRHAVNDGKFVSRLRADRVGRFLRLRELPDAREQCQNGTISKSRMRKVEDRAISDRG